MKLKIAIFSDTHDPFIGRAIHDRGDPRLMRVIISSVICNNIRSPRCVGLSEEKFAKVEKMVAVHGGTNRVPEGIGKWIFK